MQDEHSDGQMAILALNDFEDGIAASHPGIPQVYGPKFYLSSTDRDVRIAFGTVQIASTPDGKPAYIPAYKVAVFMPYQTARDLVGALNGLLQHLAEIAREGDERARSDDVE
jgi:hypothetical protein